jgi:nucleotide-binding universal stress UspA family protein
MTESTQSETMVQRIVVGVDGSETGRKALGWAAEEARLRGAVLEVVHAWHIPYAGGYPYAQGTLDSGTVEEGAQATLDLEVDSVDQASLAHPVKRTLSADGAASALLDASKGADLVVVGSRGRGGFTGLLLGSVGHQVAHHATCPAVVVPAER